MPYMTDVKGVSAPLRRAALASLNGYQRDTKYSITGLLDPPRKGALSKRHRAELREDVSDTIYRLLGTAFHALCEWACQAPTEAILEGEWEYDGDPADLVVRGPAEQRFGTTVDGHTVSAKVDYYDAENRVLYDFKTTSVWGYVYDKGEWDEQLNGTRPMLVASDLPDPQALRIVGVWRDWQKRQAGKGRYPDHQVTVLERDVWSFDECERFLADRIALHEAADVDLPECSDDERWKGYDRESKGHVYRRCDSYCNAAPWCAQHNPEV